MEFTKDLLGKTIFAIGTGNNFRRGVAMQDQPVTEFTVEHIAKKYVTLSSKSGWRTEKYCMESGATESAIRSGYSNNAGYTFFKDKEEIDEYFDFITKRDIVTAYMANRIYSRTKEEIELLYPIALKFGNNQ